MRKNYTIKNTLLAFLLLASCAAFSQPFTNGVFVLNEGGAGSNNASVSFIVPETTSISNGIFASVNPNEGPLGDTAQSMNFEGDYIYIVLNISNTVKVIKKNTFEYVATVSAGLENPRYMAFANGKGYITNWGSGTDPNDDYVAILDLQTNTITGTIPLPEGVERIINPNGKLYVAHQGGYGFGNTISVINPETDAVETTITVGDVPNRMIVKDNLLYVLCGGKPFWAPTPTDGSLVKVDLADHSVISTDTFTGLNTANLQMDETDLYFTADAEVYKAPIATPLDYTEIITLEPQGTYGIYGMDLIDNQLFVADAADYVSPGTAYVYTPAGGLLNAYTVGVIPNSFYKAESNLAVDQFASTSIALYPNPATDRFFLHTNQNPTVAVYDYSGRRVFQKTYTETGIDVSNLPSGIYMIRISDKETTHTQKLLVK
ncbi:DUF5074 domain-containing protein [Flavobacterium sp.]|uniref:YncE family protein n=1 Tax=Flavobacterium sp. TaxID=239 RepID=UPI0039E611DE